MSGQEPTPPTHSYPSLFLLDSFTATSILYFLNFYRTISRSIYFVVVYASNGVNSTLVQSHQRHVSRSVLSHSDPSLIRLGGSILESPVESCSLERQFLLPFGSFQKFRPLPVLVQLTYSAEGSSHLFRLSRTTIIPLVVNRGFTGQ